MAERGETFHGPWKVIPGDSLKGRPKLLPGEIIKHRSGSLILNCPVCNAMQFVVDELLDSKESPTLRKSHTCGAGMCKRCSVIFTVQNGRTKIIPDSPEEEKPRIDIAKIERDANKPNAEETAAKLEHAGVGASAELTGLMKQAEESIKKRGS